MHLACCEVSNLYLSCSLAHSNLNLAGCDCECLVGLVYVECRNRLAWVVYKNLCLGVALHGLWVAHDAAVDVAEHAENVVAIEIEGHSLTVVQA